MGLATDDVLAIQQLYAKYNHAIDSGNGSGWAGCFTAEGTFASSASGTMTGTEALAGFAKGFAERLKARHWTNNLVIEPAEGGAKGTCYLMLLRIAEGSPATLLTTGIYNDQLVKQNGEWKFASRSVAGD